MAIKSVRAHQLARELRRLRSQAGLTLEQVAAQLDWSSSKLGRIENVTNLIKPDDVQALCEMYGADTALQAALIQLAHDARRRGWWTAYGDVFTGSYVALEYEATLIRSWAVQLIPGLLQTEDYARAVITASHGTDTPAEEINRRVMARMARKTLLTRDQPPQLHAVIDEAVLHRPVGGTEVMQTQLISLQRSIRRPNVTLQILPFGAGQHAGMEGGFVILAFAAETDLDIAYVEGIAGDVYVESSAQVDRYTLRFERITAAALSPEESAGLLAAHIKE